METHPNADADQPIFSADKPYVPDEIHVEGFSSVYVAREDGTPGARFWVNAKDPQSGEITAESVED